MSASEGKLHGDSLSALELCVRICHQRSARMYSSDVVLHLFSLLEEARTQLKTTVKENGGLIDQIGRLKRQIENYETSLGQTKKKVRQLQSELAAKCAKVDSLSAELQEHQRVFHAANNELQSAVGRRQCNTYQRMPSNGSSTDSVPNIGRRPHLLLPPPLQLTPLSSRFPRVHRRSVSAEPRPTPVQKNMGQKPQHSQPKRQRLDHAFVMGNNSTQRQCPSPTTSSTYAASTSAMSSNCSTASSAFSADGGLLGPVTYLQRRNNGANSTHNYPQNSWMANRIRKGQIFPRPY